MPANPRARVEFSLDTAAWQPWPGIATEVEALLTSLPKGLPCPLTGRPGAVISATGALARSLAIHPASTTHSQLSPALAARRA